MYVHSNREYAFVGTCENCINGYPRTTRHVLNHLHQMHVNIIKTKIHFIVDHTGCLATFARQTSKQSKAFMATKQTIAAIVIHFHHVCLLRLLYAGWFALTDSLTIHEKHKSCLGLSGGGMVRSSVEPFCSTFLKSSIHLQASPAWPGSADNMSASSRQKQQ